MNDRESLARDLVLAVASSHITESEPSWETMADRLLSYGWGQPPKAPLVVVDRSDLGVLRRVTDELSKHWPDATNRCGCGASVNDGMDYSQHLALAALAALAGDQR